jgi:hypothetical protein
VGELCRGDGGAAGDALLADVQGRVQVDGGVHGTGGVAQGAAFGAAPESVLP